MNPTIEWNNQVKLIISDVDETIADLYLEAAPELIRQLERLLEEGKTLFLISGQSVRNICWRVINQIDPELRSRVIIGHCSGVEVWGFNQNGNLRVEPYYTLYNISLTRSQKESWREIISLLVREFSLQVFPTMAVSRFKAVSEGNPLAVMFEDRGPQITIEVVNGYQLKPEQMQEIGLKMPQVAGFSDLRLPIMALAQELLENNGVPIIPHLAGEFAIDFAIKGVSKTTAVRHVVENDSILAGLRLCKEDISNPTAVEVWGDKFSVVRGGTDRHISEALLKEVRSITFRQEDPAEFPPGYNIVVWDGKERLQNGLLEYLQDRR